MATTRNGERQRFPDGFRILQGKQEYITYTDHSSVRLWPSDTANHYDSHNHTAVEIIMPHRGVSIYRLPEEKVFHVGPGEILIVPPGCFHSLTESGDIQRYLLLFEPEPIAALQDMADVSHLLKEPIYLNDQSELHQQVKQLLDQLIDCYQNKQPMWNAQCYAYLIQCYALIGREYLLHSAPAATVNRWRVDPELMNSARVFIQQHYMEDISLDDAASFVGFSKYYFSRTFKEFFGNSFSDYLMICRLNHAASLLSQTTQSVHDIAIATGFGSIATFNRSFRAYKNCTPSQFRSIYGSMITDEAKP